MVKQIWMSLPVKDIGRSTAFFKALGFAQTPHGLLDMKMKIALLTSKKRLRK